MIKFRSAKIALRAMKFLQTTGSEQASVNKNIAQKIRLAEEKGKDQCENQGFVLV